MFKEQIDKEVLIERIARYAALQETPGARSPIPHTPDQIIEIISREILEEQMIQGPWVINGCSPSIREYNLEIVANKVITILMHRAGTETFMNFSIDGVDEIIEALTRAKAKVIRNSEESK